MGIKDQGVTETAGRWLSIPRTLCFITHGDDVLLLKRSPHQRIFPNRYNGVGGHIERDEDPLSGVVREVQEETGLDVHDVRLRGVIHVDAGDPQIGILVFVFSAQANSREFTDSVEGTLEWVARERVDELPLVDDLPMLLPLALDAPTDAPPFFAHTSYDEQDRIRFILANPL